ncbi:hypothetical protein [Pseudanabaena sp. PCC 6802]|uniref:hypothetical protein n=1 Tax=Pseudanabaena sp. PCC 6802 TaxID=118173 RepID=UPI000349C09F|nr:hypothetical protein [Pseudanabaena sp. PCC 6802]
MRRKELKAAKIRFEDIERYLRICDRVVEDERSLTISCSESVARNLKSRLDALLLKYDCLEKITINGEIVYRHLPVLLEPPGKGFRLERVEIDLSDLVKIPLRQMKKR